MKKFAIPIFFVSLFLINTLAAATPMEDDKAGDSSLALYASRRLKDYPALFPAHKTSYFETYWSFQGCRQGQCGPLSSEAHLTAEDRQKAAEAQNFIEQVLSKKLKEFDQWAHERLPFWKQWRHQVFPVTILLEAFPENPMAPSAAVIIQEFEYEDRTGTRLTKERRPTIYIDITQEKSFWSIYSPMLTHEFGHALLYSLGIPQYLSPLDETFADMLMLTFHQGTSVFLPELVHSSRRALLQGLSEAKDEGSRQFYQETLRIMSEKGVRDFGKQGNPRFPEVFRYPELYFISSMVNTTFHSLSTKVSMERWTEAFLNLLQTNSNSLLDMDLSVFMSALLKKYRSKHPREFQENKNFIKEVLSAQKWQKIQEISMNMKLSDLESENQKRKLLVHLPMEKSPAMDQKWSTILIQLFGGNKIIGHATCRSSDKCKELKFILNPQKTCVSSPCTCFTEPTSIETQFLYLGTDGYIRKSEKLRSVIPPIDAGCYWVSYE